METGITGVSGVVDNKPMQLRATDVAAVCHMCSKKVVHKDICLFDEEGRFMHRPHSTTRAFALCKEHERHRLRLARIMAEKF